MALTSSTNRITYTGDGSTPSFALPYLVYDATHVQVYLDAVLQSTGYTVSGVGSASGVTVTFAPAPALNVTIVLQRVVPLTQLAIYDVAGAFPAKTTEKNFDLAVMRAQQHETARLRSLRQADGDSADIATLPILATRANKYLVFDSSGNPTAVDAATASGTSVLATGSTTARLLADRFADWYNAKDFGINPANTAAANDTALAAAAASIPTGATLFFPYGVYNFNTFTWSRPVTLEGAGWQTTTLEVFGHANWNDTTKNSGTILRCAATSGIGITFDHATLNQAYNLRNIAIIGPGSGTSTGVKVGSAATASVMGDWRNVLIANFATGLNLTNVQDYSFLSVRVRGNTTNLSITSCYQNTYYNLELQKSTTALAFNSGGLQTFYGGLVQGNTTGLSFIDGASNGGEELVFDGMWFESLTTPISIDSTVSAWTGLTFKNCRSATSGQMLTYVGSTPLNYMRLLNNQWAGADVTIPAHAINTYVANNKLASYTDNSTSLTDPTVQPVAYKTGTWTPAVGGTATYTTQVGTYTKVGRLVTVHCELQINVIGTGSATTISGLPFAAASGNRATGPIHWATGAVSPVQLFARLLGSGTSVEIYGTTAAAAAATTQAVMGNGTLIQFSLTYLTT